ncbi:MAG: alpha/beta hydrolase [Planctomycetota bacterium]|nr:alpha/beta hydrolase [Planctomycetota bacterium]
MKRTDSVSTTCTLLRILFSLWITLSMFPRSSCTVLGQPISDSNTENWVGWIESPQEHLRWMVRLTKDPKSERVSGTVMTPDRPQESIALNNIRTKSEDWGFEWVNASTNQQLKFTGKLENPDQVTGLLIAGSQTLVIKLRKVAEIPIESSSTLGADTVWTDNLPSIAGKDKFDMRFRIYTSPPYAEEKKPKILFDSISTGLIGKPVELVSDPDSSLVFKIPAIQSEYRASFDPNNEILLGTFSRNGSVIPLKLTKVEAIKESTSTRPDSPAKTKQSTGETSPTKSASIPQTENAEDASVKIKMAEQPARIYASNEKSITIPVGQSSSASMRGTNDAVSRLGGTLTLPSIEGNSTTNSAKVPVIIFVSTYGPQDRDGLMGTNAHYRDLAQSLAKMGYASIRMDDRGMGSSDEPAGAYTPLDADKDLRAVLQFALSTPELDANRIGILGHGEGANFATAIAAIDTRIRFLILLAPPGLNGSELLLSQSARIANLQRISERDQLTMQKVQRGVHKLAMANLSAGSQSDEVRRLVTSLWSDIQKTLPTPTSESELQGTRRSIEQQLLADVMELQQPVSQQFLKTDPAKNWMLLRCPTLAVWGANDLEVIPVDNRKALQATTARNSKSSIQWLELPGLNHWFQKATTGSTEEYETLGGIDPSLIEPIKNWLTERF